MQKEHLTKDCQIHELAPDRGTAERNTRREIALTAVLETRHTDAIVLLGDMQDQPRLLDDLRGSAVPVVALWQGSSPLEFPTADPDDRAGILAGLAHVAALGHTRIAFVSAHLQGDFRYREDAYVEFMTKHFGGVPAGYLQRVPNTLAGGERALRDLFGVDPQPTAGRWALTPCRQEWATPPTRSRCTRSAEPPVAAASAMPDVADFVPGVTTSVAASNTRQRSATTRADESDTLIPVAAPAFSRSA